MDDQSAVIAQSEALMREALALLDGIDERTTAAILQSALDALTERKDTARGTVGA